MTPIPTTIPSLSSMPFLRAMQESGDVSLASQKLMAYAINRNNPVDMRFYCLISNIFLESKKPMEQVWQSFLSQFGTMEAALQSLDSVVGECSTPMIDSSHAIDYNEAESLVSQAKDIDYRWVCISCVCISIVDHQMRLLEPLSDGIKPHSTWSLMKIRTRNLYTSARKRIDKHIVDMYKNAYPYAHDELNDAEISALDFIQAESINEFGKRLDVAYKANLIAAQRSGLAEPKLAAGIYQIGRIIYATKKWMQKSNEQVKRIWPYKATTEKPPVLYATRELNDLWTAYQDLRKAVGLNDVVLSGDFADKAETDYDKIETDIVGDVQFLLSKRTEGRLAFEYADLSLASIVIRLQGKQPLPLSWARDIYHRFGGKREWRKFIGMCRNPKFWRGMPMDDVLDLRDAITVKMSKWQYIKDVKLSEDGKDATISILAPGLKSYDDHKYGIVMRWRAMIVSCDCEKPDVEETLYDSLRREMWAWHYHNPGQSLPDYHLVWIWAHLKSIRAVNRLLADLGPVAAVTRRRTRNMRYADYKAITDEIVLRRARNRGIIIPKELEQDFLSKAILRPIDRNAS